MNVQDIVKAIYAITGAAGIGGVIAGGSARDHLHNLTPKDYDFVLLGLPTADAVANALRRAGQPITAEYSDHYGNSERFAYCVKTRIMGVDVDFIGLKCKPESVEEILDTFDFDINQCHFDREGTVVIPDHYPAIGDEIYVMRHDEITAERTKRLATRFPQYDWADAINESKGK